MIDLHSHVLFDIDDGAAEIEDSVQILRRAGRKGITKMMATPHFSVGESVDEFVKMRDERIKMLKAKAKQEGIDIQLKAGAEVYITDELFNEDELGKLVLGDSNVILTEFSYYRLTAEKCIEYVDEIINKGFRILLAHPERYAFLVGNRVLLEALCDRGVMLQVNAISLFEEGEGGDFARMAVRSGLAFAIGSDIHHASSKRLDAMGELGKNTDEKIRAMLRQNPDTIFDGKV